MILLNAFGSESVAADLLQQVRWRDGVCCPYCCSDRTVRNGSCGQFQWYLRKGCDRTFNDKTGTIFAHSKIALRRWLSSIYTFLRFNTSLRQLQCKTEVTTKQSTDVSSASPKRSTRRHLNSVDRSRLTSSTSLPARNAASATSSRALVASPDAGAGSINKTSRLWSSLWIETLSNGTLCQRNPQMNRRSGSCWLAASRRLLLSIPTDFARTTLLNQTNNSAVRYSRRW